MGTPYVCPDKTFKRQERPDVTHVTFRRDPDIPPEKGAPGIFYVPVCGKPPNARRPGSGAAYTRYSQTLPVGCLPANMMCCGSRAQNQCMLYADSKGDLQWDSSAVKAIEVPCGVKVVASYATECKPNDKANVQPPSNGGETIFAQSGKFPYPYAFQISLEDGFECRDDGNVYTKDGRRPCDPDDPPSGGVPPDGGQKPLTAAQILTGAGVIGAALVLVVVLATWKPKAQAVVTVADIVRSAGVNQHLVAPAKPV